MTAAARGDRELTSSEIAHLPGPISDPAPDTEGRKRPQRDQRPTHQPASHKGRSHGSRSRPVLNAHPHPRPPPPRMQSPTAESMGSPITQPTTRDRLPGTSSPTLPQSRITRRVASRSATVRDCWSDATGAHVSSRDVVAGRATMRKSRRGAGVTRERRERRPTTRAADVGRICWRSERTEPLSGSLCRGSASALTRE